MTFLFPVMYLFFVVLTAMLLYFIIKIAVKAAIKESVIELKERSLL